MMKLTRSVCCIKNFFIYKICFDNSILSDMVKNSVNRKNFDISSYSFKAVYNVTMLKHRLLYLISLKLEFCISCEKSS